MPQIPASDEDIIALGQEIPTGSELERARIRVLHPEPPQLTAEQLAAQVARQKAAADKGRQIAAITLLELAEILPQEAAHRACRHQFDFGATRGYYLPENFSSPASEDPHEHAARLIAAALRSRHMGVEMTPHGAMVVSWA